MSNRLNNTPTDAVTAIATAAASLPFPPVAGQMAVVPDGWANDMAGVVPEFELLIWGEGALTLTSGELWSGQPRDATLAAVDVDADTGVDTGADEFTSVAHGLLTGDGPGQWTSDGALPTGLALLTDYWVIESGDPDVFQVAASLEDALNGIAVGVSTTGGAGATHTFTPTGDAQRMRWASDGLLDASIALDVDKAYRVRCDHLPGVVAYAVAGTLSASAVTGTIKPIQER